MRLAEKFCLCSERGMVAAPPMNKDYRRKALVNIFISKNDSVFLNQFHKSSTLQAIILLTISWGLSPLISVLLARQQMRHPSRGPS